MYREYCILIILAMGETGHCWITPEGVKEWSDAECLQFFIKYKSWISDILEQDAQTCKAFSGPCSCGECTE